MTNNKIYAGVGSRKTPREVCTEMTSIAEFLEERGYLLRSGSAIGADTAFESGVTYENHQEIWHKNEYTAEGMQLACQFHPAWTNLTADGQRLMARNSHIILGEDLNTPVHFIVCWTPNGNVVGGTGQGLRMAKEFNIEVINLALTEFPYQRFYS
jgi:hypothetical protein